MEQFGKYQLIRRIGAGGMAEVFLSRTTVAHGLAKELVIKKIQPAHARSRLFQTMFVAEAKIALSLNHPNIVQVFDFGAVEETFFLAMEYIDGVDLLRVLQAAQIKRRPIPLELCAHIVREVAKGLHYAHRKTDEFGQPLGIVHRDISPQNILLSWEGAVKIVDFGIARTREVQDEGVVKGKHAYMAPEQAAGAVVDQRADVFSAGVVLFELCCGRRLFSGPAKEALAKLNAGIIPRPRVLRPEISESLEQTILTALAYSVDSRFASARELQLALSRVQLDVSQKRPSIVDSEALAQFLADLFPDERRSAEPVSPGASALRAELAERVAQAGIATSGETVIDVSFSEKLELGWLGRASEPPREIREHKHVMVLAGHVRGLSALMQRLGKSHASKVVSEFFRVAGHIVFKHHGELIESGESGPESFVAVMGLPIASEDDASRTIELALDLIDALDGIGNDVEPELRLAVGIQRGLATIVRTGAERKTELGLAEKHLAVRLAQLAHGAEVLVGGHVFRLAKRSFSFEELSTVELLEPEGAEEQQRTRVFRLRGPKERAVRIRERAAVAGELVGRELELKALRDAYRDVVTTGRPRSIVIMGDAGVGKRTLVNAFLAGIPAGEASVRRATPQTTTLLSAYGTIGDLLRDILNLADSAEPRKVQGEMARLIDKLFPEEVLAPHRPSLTAALCTVLGVPPQEGTGNPEKLHRQVMELMLRLEDRLNPGKHFILVIEDLHWADQQSVEVFRELALLGKHRPYLAIVTSRPDIRIARLAAEISADTVHLSELDPESSARLITRRFAPDADVTELVREILAHTGGNPHFITEMLDSLVERGIVQAVTPDSKTPDGADGAGVAEAPQLQWVRRDIPIQVPTSVEALLAARIDRLTPELKEVLLCASVMGRSLRADAVEALVQRPVRADLDALVARGLLSHNEHAPGHYGFRDHMTMTVAYGLIPAAERTRFHLRANEHFVSHPSYLRGRDDTLLARHYELAGDTLAAAEHYISGAAYAREIDGTADALRWLERALLLLEKDDHERRFRAHELREDILRLLARRPEQLIEAKRMLHAAEALADPAKQARAYVRIAIYHIGGGSMDEGARISAQAQALARVSGDALTLAEALTIEAKCKSVIGSFVDTLRLCEQALALCDDSAAGLECRARCLLIQGWALSSTGSLDRAVESFAEALVIFRMRGITSMQGAALNNIGIVFCAMSDYEQALAHFKGALTLDQKIGHYLRMPAILGNIGSVYSELGDTDRAERYLQKALKVAEQSSLRSAETDVIVTLGDVYMERAEYERARQTLQRGLERATELRDRYQEVHACGSLAILELRSGGDAGRALAFAQQAADVARDIHYRTGQTLALALEGLALAAQGRAAEAAAMSTRALALQSQQPNPERVEIIYYIHGEICDRAGRHKEAGEAIARAWSAASAKAERLEDPALRQSYLGSSWVRAIRRKHGALLGRDPLQQ